MNTLAHPNTITVIDLILQGDPAVSAAIRKRTIALISHGDAAATAGPDPWCSEDIAAHILGLDRTTLGKWRRGLLPKRGPFPFTVSVDLLDRVRYRHAEAVEYIQTHRETHTNRPQTQESPVHE
jgi:hypothetical protein